MIYYLLVFFISMVPLIELRGAIPYAVFYNLNMPLSYLLAIVGNMIPVPIIFFFVRRVLEWGVKVNWPKGLKWIGKFFNFCLEKGEKGGRKLTEKAGRSTYLALFLFVGIPIPGTGAWMGCLIAALLNMDKKKSLLYAILGVIMAGIIMMMVLYGILDKIIY